MSELTLTEKQNNNYMLKVQDNALVISNIIELTTNIITVINGKDISDSLSNQSLNRKVISNLVANYIKNRIFNKKM